VRRSVVAAGEHGRERVLQVVRQRVQKRDLQLVQLPEAFGEGVLSVEGVLEIGLGLLLRLVSNITPCQNVPPSRSTMTASSRNHWSRPHRLGPGRA
jgi:hypothetical protein